MRKDLREALEVSKAFITQIPIMRKEEDDEHYHQISKHFSCITFTPNDV